MNRTMNRMIVTCASALTLAFGACSSEPKPEPPPPAPKAEPVQVAAPVEPKDDLPPGMRLEKELQYDVVPSAAQTAMALQLANQLMLQGKLEEAEVRYKVAAAGGSSEAEKMLMKLRTEITAKSYLDSAKQKSAYGDYEGALSALSQVPASSMLRKSADALVAQIKEKQEAMQKALEASIQQGLGGTGDAAATE